MAIDRVTEVNLYAMKSGGETLVMGSKPKALDVGLVGFEAFDVRDREFLVVEATPDEDGNYLFVSQRGWDKRERETVYKGDKNLSYVKLDILPEELNISTKVGSFSVKSAYSDNGIKRNVTVFGELLPQAIDQGDDAANTLSELVGRDVRLVRANRGYKRMLPETFQRPDAVNEVAGADGMPFLLLNQKSLDNSHLSNGLTLGSVPIQRYRGNIILSGKELGAYNEDKIRKLKIGNFVAYVVKPGSRCVLTNINQLAQAEETTVGGLRVLRGRAGYFGDSDKRDIFFGQNLNHIYVPGTKVSVGDKLEVLEDSTVPNFTPA